MGKRIHIAATAAFLIWSSLIISAYARGFSFSGAGAQIPIKELGLALVIMLSGLHAGNLLFRLFRTGETSPLEEALFSTALGLGLLSMATFVLGLFHGYYSWAAALLLGGFCLVGIGNYRYARSLALSLRTWRPSFSGLEYAMLFALFGFAAITLMNALTPPFARDSLIHHLAIPQWYLRHQGIVDIPFSPPSYYPPLVQTLYALGLLLSSDILAQLVHFFFYVGSLLFAFALARRCLSRPASLLAPLLFGSLPVACQVAATAYADFGLTFYALAGFHALSRWSENRSDRWYALAAVMTAWAVACKYNGFIVLLCYLAGIMMVFSRRQTSLASMGKRIALFLLIVVSLNLLWLGRNFCFTGNPIYPLANEHIGTPWLPDQPKFSSYQARHLLYGEGLLDQVLVPWNLSVKTRSDARHELDGVANPVFLLFLPFFVFLPKKPPGVRGVAFFALIYFLVFWASANIRLRYLMPIFPMLAIMTAYAVAALEMRGKKILISCVMIFALLLNLYWILVYTFNLKPLDFLMGKESRQAFLCRHIPCYPVFEYANTHLPPEARVMFLYGGKHGNDGYYLDRDYFYDFMYLGYTGKRILEKAGDPRAVRDGFRNLGVTHLLINWELLKIDFSSSLPANKVILFEKFAQDFLCLEFKKEGSYLYRLV